MTRDRKYFGILAAMLVLGAGVFSAAARADGSRELAESSELWGGPAAVGAGVGGSRFESSIYITSASKTSGTLDYYLGGSLVASTKFDASPDAVTVLSCPSLLDDKGAFLYHIRAQAPVSAWSETYNDTPEGRFGVSMTAFRTSDFLNPGDLALGGGVQTYSAAGNGKARTNAGIICSPNAAQSCQAEVSLFKNGVFVGRSLLEAVPGSVKQASLASLIPASAESSGLAVRFGVFAGPAQPYVIRNYNDSHDGVSIPLTVGRNAFSTAPIINRFSADPAEGCAPLATTLTWSTTGAVRVIISGITNDLPVNGSIGATISKTSEFLLTAFSATGESSSRTLRVSILPATPTPVPQPSVDSTSPGGLIRGYLPSGIQHVAWEFLQQQSTGSKFELAANNTFTYTAGTTLGTDIIQFTVTGSCGPETATFTAQVVKPGAPTILIWEADPFRGCSPAQIVLHWITKDAKSVKITGTGNDLYDFQTSGSYPVELTATTTFNLTAYSSAGTSISKELKVIVDDGPVYTTVTPQLVQLRPSESVLVRASVSPASTPLDQVAYYFRQNQSRGSFIPTGEKGVFRYTAGWYSGEDMVEVGVRNGCGVVFTQFRATVLPPVVDE